MSTVSEILQKLSNLKPELSAKYHVSTLGLFGSATRSDFSIDSDIDLIVDFSKPIGVEFIDLADYLEYTLNRKVDLVSKNGVRPAYFEAIEKDIIYV